MLKGFLEDAMTFPVPSRGMTQAVFVHCRCADRLRRSATPAPRRFYMYVYLYGTVYMRCREGESGSRDVRRAWGLEIAVLFRVAPRERQPV